MLQKLKKSVFKQEKYVYFISVLVSKLINRFKNPHQQSYNTILVVKLDEIGDMVTSLHVFEFLKVSYPDANITLWCKSFITPLVKNDPNIHRVINHVKDLEKKYDLIIDLRGNWQSIWYAISHPSKYRLDRARIRLINKLNSGHPHEVETNLQVIMPVLKQKIFYPKLKIYFSEEDTERAKAYIQENKLTNYAILHIGTRRALKKWPIENYILLASYLKKEKNLDVVFCGDANDAIDIAVAQKIIPFKTYSIAGTHSLLEFAALASYAKIFIGNDSGPMHISSAVDILVLGLFGPSEPTVFYPYGKKSTYIHYVLECNPCDQIHCVFPENTCIKRIKLEEVIQKINELGV